MTKKSIVVGLCVVLPSTAVSTSVEAQQDKRQTPHQKRDRTERADKSERGRREKVVVMTKQEPATLVDAIVTAAEENDVIEEVRRPARPHTQQHDMTITGDKDRDPLCLLLQYHNLSAMRTSILTFAQPIIQARQPISWGGQLCYSAGSSNLVVTQGVQGAPIASDADKIRTLEDELARLKEAQQNPQRNDDQTVQQLTALRQQISELEKTPAQTPVYNYDNRWMIHQDRSRNSVQLSRNVFLKINSDVLNAEGPEVIRNVADFITGDPRALVLVYGYANIGGPATSNNRLAAKRAANVIEVFQTAGVPAAAIKRCDNGADTTPSKRADARYVDMDVVC